MIGPPLGWAEGVVCDEYHAETLDSLVKDAVKSGTPIDGADGLLNELTKAVLERAMDSELTHHLGYEAGDPAGRGSGNSRNGATSKTVTTVNGPVDIAAPRDCDGSFEPVIVPKKKRRLACTNPEPNAALRPETRTLAQGGITTAVG